MQAERGVAVFCYRFCSNSPNLERVLFANYSRTTAKERRIPEVIAFLQHLVKQFVAYWNFSSRQQVALERVGVIKPVRCLHKRHVGVKKEADGVQKKILDWHVVAVEN